MAACSSVDILIIGAGLLGTVLADRVLRHFGERRRVVCLRLCDAGRPQCETLRNQGILLPIFRQGLLPGYALRETLEGSPLVSLDDGLRGLDPDASPQEPLDDWDGRTMLSAAIGPDAFGLAFGGLREFSSGGSREAFLHRMDGFPRPQARPADEGRASLLAGPLYNPASTYVETAETTFDEATLLSVYRDRAVNRGAQFRVIDGHASIRRDPNSPSGVVAYGDGWELASNVCILAAGAGNACLMRQAGSPTKVLIRRTPLYQLDGDHYTNTPVFTGLSPSDRANSEVRYSVTRHASTRDERRPSGAVVVGAKVSGASWRNGEPDGRTLFEVQTVDPGEALPFRTIPHEIQEEFMTLIPPALRHGGRFRAGFEPIPAPGRQSADAYPYIEQLEGTSTLAVFPGRATSALVTAGIVLCSSAISANIPGEHLPDQFDGLPGREWVDTPAMHFDAAYTHLDERELRGPREAS